jgi:hypothetical protein
MTFNFQSYSKYLYLNSQVQVLRSQVQVQVQVLRSQVQVQVLKVQKIAVLALLNLEFGYAIYLYKSNRCLVKKR